MSIIEKAAKKYKSQAAKKTNPKNTTVDCYDTEDQTEIIIPPTAKIRHYHDSDKLDFNFTPENNQDDTDETIPNAIDTKSSTVVQDDDLLTEDKTLFPEEDITDISGFNGFSVKAKKSTHSNNLHIDLNKLKNDGFLSPKYPDTALSSIYRMIKRPLLNNAMGKGASIVKHPNLIQVTSSFASEGKTYSAINIAISIAMEQDLNVLLIDADIRKPSIAKTFNLDVKQGLTDLLSGDVKDMKSVLYNTNIPSLTLMCAGKPHPNGTELLSSEAMHQFINEIATRYPNRIIIFDSPPLLQTTESNTLASHMGQIVLVVEAEKTLAPEVKKSIEILQNEIILLLLNKQREKKNDITYGYGYGY